ncbi:MAG: lipocalin family protein [Holophaga sp.]|nr:lipocalin family protein [Holophaga sp.]
MMRPRHPWLTACLSLSSLLLLGCQSPAPHPPIALAPRVEIPRMMGDWYVIANIPTFIEKGAHNAMESYRQDQDGTIATTFTFRANGFDGERKTYHPRGFVKDATGAVWGMRFVWPFKADYRIVHVAEDYGQIVIGRQARDYVWIMARTPTIPEADYQRLVTLIGTQGYDIRKIERVPQRW